MKHYYQQQAQEQQQQAAIDRINAKNAPINNAISAIACAINSSSDSSKQHKKCVSDNFGQTVCGYNCYVDQFGQGHCASK